MHTAPDGEAPPQGEDEGGQALCHACQRFRAAAIQYESALHETLTDGTRATAGQEVAGGDRGILLRTFDCTVLLAMNSAEGLRGAALLHRNVAVKASKSVPCSTCLHS